MHASWSRVPYRDFKFQNLSILLVREGGGGGFFGVFDDGVFNDHFFVSYFNNLGSINAFAPLANATREQAFKLVDNLYQQFALKDSFNRSLPTKSLGEFLVYNNEQTDLDYYLNQGRLVIISKGISSFGEAVNIKEDHYQVYRILESNENIPFQVIDKAIGRINDLYDPVAQRYLEATLYYDLTTGQLAEKALKPGILIESSNDLKITVKLY